MHVTEIYQKFMIPIPDNEDMLHAKHLLSLLEKLHILQTVYKLFMDLKITKGREVIHIENNSLATQRMWKSLPNEDFYVLKSRHTHNCEFIDKILFSSFDFHYMQNKPEMSYLKETLLDYSNYECMVSPDCNKFHVLRLDNHIYAQLEAYITEIATCKQNITQLIEKVPYDKKVIYSKWNNLQLHLSLLHFHQEFPQMIDKVFQYEPQFHQMLLQYYNNYIFYPELSEHLKDIVFGVKYTIDELQIFTVHPKTRYTEVHPTKLIPISAHAYRIYSAMSRNRQITTLDDRYFSFFVYDFVISSLLINTQDTYLLNTLCNPFLYNVYIIPNKSYIITLNTELIFNNILDFIQPFEKSVGLYHSLAILLKQPAHSTHLPFLPSKKYDFPLSQSSMSPMGSPASSPLTGESDKNSTSQKHDRTSPPISIPQSLSKRPSSEEKPATYLPASL